MRLRRDAEGIYVEFNEDDPRDVYLKEFSEYLAAHLGHTPRQVAIESLDLGMMAMMNESGAPLSLDDVVAISRFIEDSIE